MEALVQWKHKKFQLFNTLTYFDINGQSQGSPTPKASPPDAPHTNFRGVSIYRIQSRKMIETWHVSDGLPPRI